MAKEAPWHSKTMSLPGASLVGGDERVYHDNDACPVGQRIPAVRRNDGGVVPTCRRPVDLPPRSVAWAPARRVRR